MIRFAGMQTRTGTILTTFLFLAVSFSCLAATGDIYTINGSIVNIREGPGTNYPVVLKFKRGREVEEKDRLDDWVEILTGRSDVASGWVHGDLLSEPVSSPRVMIEPEKQEQPQETEQPGNHMPPSVTDAMPDQGAVMEAGSNIQPSPAFGAFLEKFNHYLELREQETGFIPFINVQDLGKRIIRVTASDEWLNRSQPYRETELTTIFKMWDKNEGSGSSLTVEIVDNSGEKVMYMHR